MKCSNPKCNKEVNRMPSEIKRSKSGLVYCSKSCAVSNNNRRDKHGENHPNYSNGVGSYRSKKLKISEKKCEHCGWDDERVLQVHHIDGNRKNNIIDNLSLLCANCHVIAHKERVVG